MEKSAKMWADTGYTTTKKKKKRPHCIYVKSDKNMRYYEVKAEKRSK